MENIEDNIKIKHKLHSWHHHLKRSVSSIAHQWHRSLNLIKEPTWSCIVLSLVIPVCLFVPLWRYVHSLVSVSQAWYRVNRCKGVLPKAYRACVSILM